MHTGFCLIGFLLLGASLYTMFSCKNCSPMKEYINSLDPKLRNLYKAVVEEREKLALHGLFLGLFVGFIVLYLCYNTLNPLLQACFFAGVVLLIQYLYYMLMPKKYEMLPNLENNEQIKGWWEVYKHMQYRYHMGMLLGLLAYVFIGLTFY